MQECLDCFDWRQSVQGEREGKWVTDQVRLMAGVCLEVVLSECAKVFQGRMAIEMVIDMESAEMRQLSIVVERQKCMWLLYSLMLGWVSKFEWKKLGYGR